MLPVALGTSNAFIHAHVGTTYRGTVSFENAAGRRRNRPFVVTAEHERVALVHDEEAPKTQWELQRIPSKLERVANEIAVLARVLDRGATELYLTMNRN